MHSQATGLPSRSWSRHPAHFVVETIQFVCAMWISQREYQRCRQYRPCTPQEGQLLRTFLLSVCCTHFLSLKSVASGEGIIICAVVRCDSAVFFFVCSTCPLGGGEHVCSCSAHSFNLRVLCSAPRHHAVIFFYGAPCSNSAVALLVIWQHCCLCDVRCSFCGGEESARQKLTSHRTVFQGCPIF